jgi:demethylmenaquinone methyltransferase/2-methoxy-6-polyprenyl-1,4-benzoquinol methylase
MAEDELAELLAEQVTYYRARAEEYDATYPLDDGADAEARARLVAALEALAPTGGCSSWRAAPGSGRRSSPATHAP